MPTDGGSDATDQSGDFGTSPFFGHHMARYSGHLFYNALHEAGAQGNLLRNQQRRPSPYSLNHPSLRTHAR